MAVDRSAFHPRSQPPRHLATREPATLGDSDYRHARDPQGRIYRAGSKAGLYIMFKTEPTVDTDEGWVYGTVSNEGTKVTSAGRVASCMSCHLESPHDRIFGLYSRETTR